MRQIGGFDLHGNYYDKREDAINAEYRQIDEITRMNDNTLRSKRSHTTDKGENFKNINSNCIHGRCPHFTQWNIGVGPDLYSCGAIGQSYTIDEIPDNCFGLWRGKDSKGNEVKVGDTVELLFPYTNCKCEIVITTRGPDMELVITPNSPCETIYGMEWLKSCRLVNTNLLYNDWRIPTIVELNMLHNKKWLVKEYSTSNNSGSGLWSSLNHPGTSSNWVSIIPKGHTTKELKIKDSSNYRYNLSIDQAKKQINDVTHPTYRKNYVVLVRNNEKDNKLEFTRISSRTMDYQEALEYSKDSHEVYKSIRMRKR